MKRWIALLLVLAMLPIPAAFAAESDTPRPITEADYAAVDAMWQTLEEAGERAVRSHKREAEAVAAAVEENPLYKEGTLRWQGEEHFTFETTVGVTCGWSARLRELAKSAQPWEGEATAEYECISYGTSDTAGAKDVYVLQPYYGIDSSFTKQYQTEGQTIAEATGGTYHLYTKTAATIDVVADAMEQGAVVIFDSHGDTDYVGANEDYTSGATTSYLLLQTGTGLTSADYADDNGTYHAVDYGRYYNMYYYAVDGTCIANHMEQAAPGNLLWMAICLSMATDGLHKPLMEQGVAVAYGYSQSVTFGGDYCWESCFWEEMCGGAQVKDAIAAMKEKYGCWDYSAEIYAANGWSRDQYYCATISQAKQKRAAFPIVVSAEDAYPGHGKVDDLQTVYSTWTLSGSSLPVNYTLTSCSNDESLGTVSQVGNVVTATPKPGAYILGWSLDPVDGAEVVQNGTELIVSNLRADCCLTVHFAAYQLSSRSNDESLGTVSQLGNVVTARPKDNAYIAGWTLEPANGAQVVRSGSDFIVSNLTANCCLTVSFEEKPLAQVSFSVPEGCEKESITVYVGEDITLTPPTGTPVANAHSYSFLGWALARMEDTLNAPDYFSGVYTVSESDLTLYALYSYEEGEITFYTTELKMKHCPSAGFVDVPADVWYHDAVDYALENGLMKGISQDRFDPEGKLTRAMLATILYRMSGTPEAGSHPFTDVPDGVWYSDAIAWAYENQVVKGMDADTFAPDAYITRQQAATMLYRYAKYLGEDVTPKGNLSVFQDADRIADYARQPLRWAVGEGIINGVGNGLLEPEGTATRAQIAKLIYERMELS